VGWKPTRGLVSAHGVVPACRSLDCVSIFALTPEDAAAVFEILSSPDPADPYSRQAAPHAVDQSGPGSSPKCGVIRASQLEFFGDDAARRAYQRAVSRLVSLGIELREIDYTPFTEAARLLYEGPWVAERLAAIRPFYESSAGDIHPVVREILSGAMRFSAVDAFEAQYRLQALAKQAAAQWQELDCLLLPTAGTIYRVDQVLEEPIRLNTNLGYYTNFVNLLDLCALALPAGFRDDGLPFGMTLIGRALDDFKLLRWAARYAATLSSRRLT
jgi:allophanate hydrolase